VRYGIEAQTGLIERDAGLPPDRRIEFHVGTQLGATWAMRPEAGREYFLLKPERT
jgi:uncharacterized protein (DUF736 family)